MSETLDGWFHATANWSLADFFAIVSGLFAVWFLLVTSRFIWRNRRMPIRRDAPVTGPWIRVKRIRK